jgi:hypothetical protein
LVYFFFFAAGFFAAGFLAAGFLAADFLAAMDTHLPSTRAARVVIGPESWTNTL